MPQSPVFVGVNMHVNGRCKWFSSPFNATYSSPSEERNNHFTTAWKKQFCLSVFLECSCSPPTKSGDLAESYCFACFNDAATVRVVLCWDVRSKKRERNRDQAFWKLRDGWFECMLLRIFSQISLERFKFQNERREAGSQHWLIIKM